MTGPHQPDQPNQPGQPNQPDQHTQPVTPESGLPYQPGQPGVPYQPGQPGAPDQAGQPYQQPYQPTQQYPQAQPYQPGMWGQPGGPAPAAAWSSQSSQSPPPFPPPTSPGRSKRGLIIGLVVALVVLAGGGGTWFALSQTSRHGADTPTEAALSLASAVSSGSPVGVLDALAPAEATVLGDVATDLTNEFKRLNVFRSDASPDAFAGVSIKAENLTFDEAQAERINDHLTITKLVGGTITVTSDPGKSLTQDVLDASGSRQQEPKTETIDIAEKVREDGEPIRIATVNVDGEWYPSLFYSVADAALRENHDSWPATPIPAKGANSPEEAVRQLVEAALNADVRRIIELTPPDEMGVLHDAGEAIVEAAEGDPSGAELLDLKTSTSSVSGGTRVTLTAIRLKDPSGDEVSLVRDGDCYTATAEGDTRQLCADELADMVMEEADELPRAMRQVVANLGSGVLKQGLGVVTTKVGGSHYVSPVRTIIELGMTGLRSLQPDDVITLLRSR